MSKKMRKKSSKSLTRKAAKSAAKKVAAKKTSAAKTSTNKAAGKKASAKKARPRKTPAKKVTARNTIASARAPKKKPPLTTTPAKTTSPAKAPAGPGSGVVGLVEGAQAPAFTLPRDGGGQISLKDFAGQKLVLFFYPRADTPGCTLEAISFTRLADAFAKHGTSTIGVSADPVNAQESFKNKHNLTVPLASDEKGEMLRTYGVWGKKSMYGKTFEGIIRTTLLIGPDGRIARIWRNVKVDGHAEDVLSAAQAL